MVGGPDSGRVKSPELMAGRKRRFRGQGSSTVGTEGAWGVSEDVREPPQAKAEKAGMGLEGRARPD